MKKIIYTIICLLLITFMCGCEDENNYEGQVKVTFHLEGGTYMNCTRPVVLYFDYSDDEANYICSPIDLTRKEITKSGYNLVGWYKTKIEDGEEVSYSDEFNFETDTVGKEGLNLYAYWEKKIVYVYNVCYKDASSEVIVLGTYKVKAGEKFEDYLGYADKNWGYTALGYYDEDGNPWDSNFTHPGGDVSLTINVFVDYLEGEYLIVDSADDLQTSVANNQNIYLTNNIDLEGRELCFRNYRGVLMGNGYTISNFNLKYGVGRDDLVNDFYDEGKTSLCLSLFGKTKGAVIENVNFENVTFKLDTTFKMTHKIYVAPLAVSMEDTTIKNVTFNGTFEIINLPSGFNVEENLIVVNDSAYYLIDDLSKIENVSINLTNITN